ncbi:hypothetical protein TNCV_3988281 [Trichonephila clavipes]|nr:hypothetical protein TNCV_3988281 [Trichonephila clavipes]
MLAVIIPQNKSLCMEGIRILIRHLNIAIYEDSASTRLPQLQRLDKQRLLMAKYLCLQKTKEIRKEKILKRKREGDEIKKKDHLE